MVNILFLLNVNKEIILTGKEEIINIFYLNKDFILIV